MQIAEWPNRDTFDWQVNDRRSLWRTPSTCGCCAIRIQFRRRRNPPPGLPAKDHVPRISLAYPKWLSEISREGHDFSIPAEPQQRRSVNGKGNNSPIPRLSQLQRTLSKHSELLQKTLAKIFVTNSKSLEVSRLPGLVAFPLDTDRFESQIAVRLS